MGPDQPRSASMHFSLRRVSYLTESAEIRLTEAGFRLALPTSVRQNAVRHSETEIRLSETDFWHLTQ